MGALAEKSKRNSAEGPDKDKEKRETIGVPLIMVVYRCCFIALFLIHNSLNMVWYPVINQFIVRNDKRDVREKTTGLSCFWSLLG
jgi:hypothetical protein